MAWRRMVHEAGFEMVERQVAAGLSKLPFFGLCRDEVPVAENRSRVDLQGNKGSRHDPSLHTTTSIQARAKRVYLAARAKREVKIG